MGVDLRHFRSFVVVAEEGHVGRAATRLFITQPALSRQLQALEEEIGVPLLLRVPRGVELTDAGRELLDKARTALAAAESALTIGKAAQPSGRLVVGIPLAADRDRWFGLAGRFTADHPQVELEIRTALTESLQRQVAAREIDVAIVIAPNRLPGLSYTPVRVEPLSVWAHRDHVLAGRDSLTLAELDGVAITLVGSAAGRGSGFNAHVRGLFAGSGASPVFVEPVDALPMQSLRTGEALAVTVDVGFPPDVVRIPLVPEPTMSFEVAHRADVATPAVRAFATFTERHAARA